MLECTPVEQKMKRVHQKVQQVNFYPILSIFTKVPPPLSFPPPPTHTPNESFLPLYINEAHFMLISWNYIAGKSLYRGKGMVSLVKLSTNDGLGWLWKEKTIFVMKQQPILQLIDSCTSGTLPFPLYKDFPFLLLLKIWQKIVAKKLQLKKKFVWTHSVT